MRIIYVMCFILISTMIYARTISPIKDFGKVDPSEFSLKIYSIDSSADAVFLFDRGKTYFEGNSQSFFSIIQEKHARIHLLNKKGFDNIATIEIYIYSGSTLSQNNDQLENLEAATYNLVDGKIETTKLEKSNIYKQQNGKYTVFKFTFPNIKEGSIIEYHYRKRTPRIQDMDDWHFQGTYPRLRSEFEIILPEILNYVSTSQGYFPYIIDTTTTYKQSYYVMLEGGSQSSESLNVRCDAFDHTWAIENIPALKSEPFISSLENYVASLNFQLFSIRIPDQPVKSYMNNWNEESTDLMHDEDFGKNLDDNKFLSEDLKSISNTNSLDKLKDIYFLIRNNYACTKKRALYLSQTLKQTWKTKKGNVADINLLLVAACRNKGFKAYPVLIGTREIHRPSDSYPLMDRYNYVLCKVYIDDKKYIVLDASDKHIGFKHLNEECYNGSGRTINPAYPDLVPLSPDSLKESSLTMINIDNSDKGLAGTYLSKLGYFGSQELREKINNSSEKEYFEKIKKSYSSPIDIIEPTIDSINNMEALAVVNYSFQLEKPTEDLIYFNPMMMEQQKENPFKAATRIYPIEMPYCVGDNFIFSMEIPKGYKVDDLPKSARISLNEKDGIFEYLVAHDGEKVQLQVRSKLNRATFDPEDYEPLRSFFSYIVKKENEPIVFKKISQ